MENDSRLTEVKVKNNHSKMKVLFDSIELDLPSIPEKEKEVFIDFLEHYIYDVMLVKKRTKKST